MIYGLKKFVSLCMNANPSTLELLGARESCVAHITPAGVLLRENARIFLSKRAVNSFGSYASAQLRRLNNALCHDSFSSAEQEEYLAATLNGQIEHFNRTYTTMGKDGMRVYLSDETEPQLMFNMRLVAYPLRDFAGIYAEISNIIRAYGKMNHRNRKKDEAHLYKHAMHLIRLLIMGEDILRGRGIITYREKEHELLMDIRNGKYTFESIMCMAKEYQKNFESAAADTTLPDRPDINRVEGLMKEIYRLERDVSDNDD